MALYQNINLPMTGCNSSLTRGLNWDTHAMNFFNGSTLESGPISFLLTLKGVAFLTQLHVSLTFAYFFGGGKPAFILNQKTFVITPRPYSSE